MKGWKIVVVATTLWVTLFCVQFEAAGFNSALRYNLLPGASFQQGCVSPCMCFAFIDQELKGSFRLSCILSAPRFRVYRITDIVWEVIGPDGVIVHTITGDGEYRRWGLFSGQEKCRLILNVSTDGGDPVIFDSGGVEVDTRFPGIAVPAPTDSSCLVTTLNIVAAP
jgi:hypothetical protein